MSAETSLALMQYKVLGHEGLGITEIRHFGKGSKFVRTAEEFEAEVSKYAGEDVYVGINPRSTEKGRATDVSHLTCLVIDCDPVRERGKPSSDEQHKEACSVGRRIGEDFPGTILVSSGSGCHVYFPLRPIKVTNPARLTDSTKNWMDAIRKKYQTDRVKIDAIHDLPRVIRCWGTHNSKSNRLCSVIQETVGTVRLDYTFSQEEPKEEKKEVLVSELEDRFRRLCESNAQMRGIVNQTAKFESRSEADYAFILLLVKAHFSIDEIKKLMLHNPLGRKEEFKPADVLRVVKKVKESGALSTVSMLHSCDKYFDGLDDRKMGLRTGFDSFDEMVSGLKPTKVMVFAARPTEGKTTLATQILANIAEQGKTCLYFPTEVGHEPIYDKILSRKAEVSLKKFQTGAFTPEEKERIASQRDYLKTLPLIICEDFALTADGIAKKIQEVAPQVVAIDYIQAMKYDGGTTGEIAAEMASTVRQIKEFACVYNIPILLFSQLRRGEGKLDLSMLKGSGALEELTDIISFIHTPDFLSYPREVDLAVLKSKYSATGVVKLRFWSSICKFEEVGQFATS